MGLIKISLLEMMQDRANSPSWGTKPCTGENRVLCCIQDRTETPAKIRVKRKVYWRRGNTHRQIIVSSLRQRVREPRRLRRTETIEK